MATTIVNQGPAYYAAIHKSAETAQQGCFFAKDAVDFCESLTEAKDSIEVLEEGLENIKEIASKAHQGSKEMNDQFRAVRAELDQARLPLSFVQWMSLTF